MTKIKWDEEGKRLYETGLDRGVLYPKQPKVGGYQKGVGWNGLTKVDESPEGGDATPKYANNGTYLNLVSREKFKGSISAFTYPEEWEACDGSASPTIQAGGSPKQLKGVRVTGQSRLGFGLAYRTLVGNDTEGIDHGYQIHLVYNATAGVSSRSRETINENVDASEFTWNFDTTPVEIPNLKPTAHIIIESLGTDPEALAKLETILYGSESEEPRLPMPEEVFTIVGATAG